MTRLIISNMSFQHSNGERQFGNINFTLPLGLTGLVGDNGVGKSLLLSLVRGLQEPSTGSIDIVGLLFYFGQHELSCFADDPTVGDHFDASAKLQALKNIQQGSIAEQDYQTVGDDWLFAQTFQGKLQGLSQNLHPYSKLSELSGGELSKVLLCKLFEEANKHQGMLILDEPSNHLDMQGKQWLATSLATFKGKCLMVSHERMLLSLCAHIATLSRAGLVLSELSYTALEIQAKQHEDARIKKLNQLQVQKATAKSSAQRDTEKAQKRANQGIKKGKEGGIPRVLLGAKKGKAQTSSSAKAAQHQSKQSSIQLQLDVLSDENAHQAIQFTFASPPAKMRRVLYVENLSIPFVQSTLSMEVKQGDKWHLCGSNGSGKSTVLNFLHEFNKQTCLIDQHCTLINNQANMLENLSHFCPHINTSNLRTLLATNGFKKDKVFQLAGLLSGGEKMRLAMLIASHQPNSLLLLDEPDNHLDICSKGILADALSRFEGTFILVSHDNDFVSQCGVTQTYALTDIAPG